MKISSIYIHLFLLSGASAAGPLRRAQRFHGRRDDLAASGPIYTNTSVPTSSPSSSNPATFPPSEYPVPSPSDTQGGEESGTPTYTVVSPSISFTPFGTGTPRTNTPTGASSPASSAPASVSPTIIPTGTGVTNVPFADIYPSSTVIKTTLQVTGAEYNPNYSNPSQTNTPGDNLKEEPSQKPTGSGGTIPTAINSFPATTQTVSPDVYRSNLEEAKHYNLLFSELEKDTSCSGSQVACVKGDIGRCSGGTFNIIQCDQGLACYAFPMNVTSGVQVGCWDLATAEKILGLDDNSPNPNPSTTKTGGSSKITVTITPTITVTSDKTVTGGGMTTTPGDEPQETKTIRVTVTPTRASVTVTVTEEQPSTFETRTRPPQPSTSTKTITLPPLTSKTPSSIPLTSTTTVTLPPLTSETPSSVPPSSTTRSTSEVPTDTPTKTPSHIPSTTSTTTATGPPTSLVVIPVGPPTDSPSSSPPSAPTPTTSSSGTPPPGGVGSNFPDCPGCWTYDPVSPFYITVKETVMVTTTATETETTTTTDAETTATATVLVTG